MQFELTLNHPQQQPLGPLSGAHLVLNGGPVEKHSEDYGPISELTLSGTANLCLPLLAPILRELSDNNDSRWLTLVEPPANLSRTWLREAGLNLDHIMLLRPSQGQSALQLACHLLHLGNSHTVVTWLERLPTKARRQLADAAEAGQGQALNIRIGL